MKPRAGARVEEPVTCVTREEAKLENEDTSESTVSDDVTEVVALEPVEGAECCSAN